MNRTKADWRRELRQRVAGLSTTERQRQSLALCQRLAADPRLLAARSVGVYLALPDEVDLSPLLTTLMQRNVRLAVPVLQNETWVFQALASMESLTRGAYGIAVPAEGIEVPVASLEVVLVPGRGFTAAGERLGRGKGIYDRLLQGYRGTTIGIAFACQQIPNLPQDLHDIRLSDVCFS